MASSSPHEALQPTAASCAGSLASIISPAPPNTEPRIHFRETPDPVGIVYRNTNGPAMIGSLHGRETLEETHESEWTARHRGYSAEFANSCSPVQ